MIGKKLRCMATITLAMNMALVTPGGLWADGSKSSKGNDNGGYRTTTPIKHLVVIFQENVSFDHYFATYPAATNPKHETKFTAKDDTPGVNGLSDTLLDQNNNSL